jgi:5-methylthioadenosine/S-adenosylhomocysteine deaminase
MKRDKRDDARDDGAHPERAQRVEGLSRRGMFRAAAAIAAAPFLLREADAAQRPPVAEDAGTLERLWRQGPATRQPILLRGGTIVSMDPKVGDFAKGDLLIEGKKIVSVGESNHVKAPPQA